MGRIAVALGAAALLACGPPPPKPAAAAGDPALDAAYAKKTEELAGLNAHARAAWKQGKVEEAARLVEEGRTPAYQLLTAKTPTLEAVRAVAARDQIYGEMLMANRHWAYARMLFQNNVKRWKNIQPPTEESRRWRGEAERLVAECERRMME